MWATNYVGHKYIGELSHTCRRYTLHPIVIQDYIGHNYLADVEDVVVELQDRALVVVRVAVVGCREYRHDARELGVLAVPAATLYIAQRTCPHGV